jgi:hypothetical protein
MKIICCGDWHLRTTPTKYRTPAYYDQMISKIKYIINFADEHDIFTVLQPGDFFDNPDQAYKLHIDLAKLVFNTNIDLYCVAGQHDLRYRQFDNTSLALFQAVDILELLGKEPITYDEKEPVDIYGASWGDAIPDVVNSEHYNILVLHKMIVKDKPLFPDQKDYCRSAEFASTLLDYNLIVSGDNHNSFSYIPKDKRFPSIINCGSLMRMTTAQYNHKPCFWVADTVTGKIKKHYIPILPTTDVFKEEAAEIKERNEKMEAFIETLGDTNVESKLSFEANVQILIEKLDIEVKKLANKFIKDYYA